jgi:hypothetical protein
LVIGLVRLASTQVKTLMSLAQVAASVDESDLAHHLTGEAETLARSGVTPSGGRWQWVTLAQAATAGDQRDVGRRAVGFGLVGLGRGASAADFSGGLRWVLRALRLIFLRSFCAAARTSYLHLSTTEH